MRKEAAAGKAEEEEEDMEGAEGKGEEEGGYLSFDSDDDAKSQFTSASGVDDYQNYLK